LYGVIPVEQRGVTEDGHDTVDRCVWVDRGV